jgi:hypothetical protein
MDKKFKFLMILKIIGGIILFVPLFIFGTMYLWNWLVPTLFHGPVITFWQTIGLIVLSKILFGGFGKKMGGHHDRHHNWKQRMNEKMGNMSPEEKEMFKLRIKEKCRNKFRTREEVKGNESTNNDLV